MGSPRGPRPTHWFGGSPSLPNFGAVQPPPHVVSIDEPERLGVDISVNPVLDYTFREVLRQDLFLVPRPIEVGLTPVDPYPRYLCSHFLRIHHFRGFAQENGVSRAHVRIRNFHHRVLSTIPSTLLGVLPSDGQEGTALGFGHHHQVRPDRGVFRVPGLAELFPVDRRETG